MSNDLDEIEKIISESTEEAAELESRRRAEAIGRKVQNKQGQSDYLEFGLVKIWTVLIELFSVFYVRSKERQSNNFEEN